MVVLVAQEMISWLRARGKMSWRPFEDGTTIGQVGSEGGVMIRDDGHDLGARITLERDCVRAPVAITCGIYGWFFHTRYFGSEAEGATEFGRMAGELATILASIPRVDDPEAHGKCVAVCEAIAAFVAHFP